MTTGDYAKIDQMQLAKKLRTAEPDNFNPEWGYALVHVLGRDGSERAQQIPGSVKLVQEELDVVERHFAKGKEIILYSGSPSCDASARVARELCRRGYHRIVEYAGGISDWKGAGLPIAIRPG